MVHKHFIKNAVIFTAMILIVGVNSAPRGGYWYPDI